MRRPLIALCALVLAAAGVAVALQFFSSKDDATVARSAAGPGVARTAGDGLLVRDGNVVLLHRSAADSAALRKLAGDIAGPANAKLEAAGQAVLVRRDPALAVPIAAVTATRRIEAQRTDDPALVHFVEYWLGRRAPPR